MRVLNPQSAADLVLFSSCRRGRIRVARRTDRPCETEALAAPYSRRCFALVTS
jgi:hypothetical protein